MVAEGVRIYRVTNTNGSAECEAVRGLQGGVSYFLGFLGSEAGASAAFGFQKSGSALMNSSPT